MTEFVCIGFDIRTWPTDQFFTIDATTWPQNEDVYERVKEELDLKENRFQLIQVDSQDEFDKLFSFVENEKQAVLVSVELPIKVLEACRQVGSVEIPICSPNTKPWRQLGLDVCDINGFFSIFHMNVLKKPKSELFSIADIEEALVLAQSASILVPSHSPFVVANIMMASEQTHSNDQSH